MFAAIALAAACCVLLLSVSNVLFLRAESRPCRPDTRPRVSVLIPARNEEGRIGRCLRSLIEQDYDNYEVLVYDDQSADATLAEARRYAASCRRIRVVSGVDLHPGWYAKPQAMQRLAAEASGDYYLFTDADTVHAADSISRTIACALRHRADLLSGYAHHQVESFGEGLVVAAMFVLTSMFLPLWMVPRGHSPLFAHAIGRLMCFRAAPFRAVGGYGSVRNRICEDVQMSRLMKRSGYRVVFVDAQSHVACSMYGGAREALWAISRSVADFLDGSYLVLALGTAAIAGLFLLPAALTVLWVAGLASVPAAFPLAAAIAVVAWTVVVSDRRLPAILGVLFPVTMALVILMAWLSFHRRSSGKGFDWKGRTVH
jgi:chlorobactene glucosyltransferase